MGVSVVFEGGSDAADAVEVVPGEEAVCVLRLENTGMVVDQILLDVLGAAAEWASVEPAQVNLLPGATEQVRVRFRPPRSAGLAPGDVAFGVRAMSTEDPEGSRIEEGTVKVGGFGDLAARLIPTNASGRRKARFRLVVENRGNRSERLRVEGMDPAVKLGFRIRPAVFVAAPGTATFVRLRAVPRKTFFKGTNRTLPFEAEVHSEQGDTAKAEGVMLEKQTLPEWVLPFLGISLAVAGVLLALWFAVLRPVVHSAATASNAAASAAAQAKNAAGNASAAVSKAASTPAKPPAAPASASSATSSAPPAPAFSVVLNSPLVAGASARAQASGGGTAPADLVWSSSDPSVATVNPATGLVTAVGPGTATITVKSTGKSSPVSSQTTLTVVGKLAVTTTALQNAVQGKAYTASLNGTGGTAPYTWSAVPTSLPPGLTVSAAGIISGTPTAPGTSTIVVHVADAGPPGQSPPATSLKLTVIGVPAVAVSALPDATADVTYPAQNLVASGGTGPYKWSLVPGQGDLPIGLTLDPAARTIGGFPTTAGKSSFTVQAMDANGQTATQRLTITVANPLMMTTLTLPDGVAGTQYSQQLEASGGTMPYTWSVPPAQLPAGLTLGSTTGLLSGTPQKNGTFTFSVSVADAGSPARTVSQSFSVRVVTGFAITTSSLSPVEVGRQVGVAPTVTTAAAAPPPGIQLQAGGGQPISTLPGTPPTPVYAWQPTGTLPPGLQLTSTGLLTGTPFFTGTFSFSVQAVDASSPPLIAIKNLTMQVVPALQITTVSLPYALTGQTYSHTLTASGGTGMYSWRLASGDVLPPGLGLDSNTGVLSTTSGPVGTAPIATTKLTFIVTDTGTSQTASWGVNFGVDAPLAFSLGGSLNALPEAAIGTAYGANGAGVPLAGTGGSGKYQWLATGLPNGLSVNSSGVISGTVSANVAPGPYSFQVTMSDTADNVPNAVQPLSITIAPLLSVQGTSQGSYNWQGKVGSTTPYTASVQVNGGLGPYQYAVSGFKATTSIQVSAAGQVSWNLDTPCDVPSPPSSSPGSAKFTCPPVTDSGQVTITDTLNQVVKVPVNLTADFDPLTVTYPTSATLAAGDSLDLSQGPALSGGYGGGYGYTVAPFTCPSLTAGGTTVSAATGFSQPCTVTVSITVTGPVSSTVYVIFSYQETINPPPPPPPPTSSSPTPTSSSTVTKPTSTVASTPAATP
ncbi:hypothetical protein ABIA31_006799 [Catenulispora sp. MAP5-51]|uniref:putative Ig domain-containing protein n=1 Tax=Catenulispora sp. MAP5-51 TaxID=3156298 RepID=UPI003516C7CF